MNIRLVNAGRVPYLRSQTIYHALAYARKEDTPDTIVLNIPSEPYASIGYHQDLDHEVDSSFCTENALPIVRRETGGGTVYLDDQQLFAQWIFNPKHLPKMTGDRFALFIRPLVSTYQAFGINAKFHLPNDVHVAGKKISGTGAAAIGNAEVVTGNFLFDFDYERMAQILNVPGEHFRTMVLQSMRTYMTSMRQELPEVPDTDAVAAVYVEKCEQVLKRKIVPGEFSDSEYRIMQELDKKFVTPEWIGQYTMNAHARRKVKIHAGVWIHEVNYPVPKTDGIELKMTIRTKEKMIDQVTISEDIKFHPESKLKRLEQVLHNVTITEEALKDVIESFYLLHQIDSPGISAQDWVSAILQIEKK